MTVLVSGARLHVKARRNEALELLERAFARGRGKRDRVEHDPDYDILRDDPRFKKRGFNDLSWRKSYSLLRTYPPARYAEFTILTG